MNEAITRMLAGYGCRRPKDDPRAMREILQQASLFGLWRGGFFNRAALCGGASLRLLHGLGRFEPNLEFTLLSADFGFDFSRYARALLLEIQALGFNASVTRQTAHRASQLASAFLSAETLQYDLLIEVLDSGHRYGKNYFSTRFRIEIETDPPTDATSEIRTCRLPIAFSVRTAALPDLLAVKLHALLCRGYNRREKGRDWYDLAWFAANAPEVNRASLEKRLLRSFRMPEGERLTEEMLLKMAARAIKRMDVGGAGREVAPFLRDAGEIAAWSPEFFQDVFARITMI